MNIKLISDSDDEPVSLAEAKAQVMYTGTDQDTYLSGLISAARLQAEMYNGRRFTLQQWDLALDAWPGSAGVGISSLPNPYFGYWPSDAYRLQGFVNPGVSGIALPAPLVSVESVTWKDSAGVVHLLAENTDYAVDTWKEPGMICPMSGANWPVSALWVTSAIHVTFTSGMVPSAEAYAQANAGKPVPPEVRRHIKQGIMLLVSQYFLNRVPFEALRAVAELPFSVTSLFTSDKLWV